MAEDQQQGRAIATTEPHPIVQVPSRSIRLSDTSSVDTTVLTVEQERELTMLHAKGLIGAQNRANELRTDVLGLRENLKNMAETTKEMADAGNSVTITHSTNNSGGRTEAIMGNTDTAQKGRLSRSQAGLKDMTLIYVGIAAVVIVVLALVLVRH
jgi:hypothetical protein